MKKEKDKKRKEEIKRESSHKTTKDALDKIEREDIEQKGNDKEHMEPEKDEEQVVTEQQPQQDKFAGDELGLDREELGDEKYIEALEEELGKAIAESVMCRNLTQRIQADFDNYRKRNNSIADDMKALGVSIVVEKMLGVLDNCDLARKYISDESALTGFNMMEQQILSALETFGLKEVEALDQKFDAKFMNAVERQKAEGKEDMVVEVISKGYMLNGKLLRPAGVKVGY